MKIITHGPEGQPLEPIEPGKPTLFDGNNFFVFDDQEELDMWISKNLNDSEEEN